MDSGKGLLYTQKLNSTLLHKTIATLILSNVNWSAFLEDILLTL